jgi:GT2 family glycosyltransferase/SAM-dependent methyltransferase
VSSVATGFTATDVAVVIPTRDRWSILARTLEGLRRQSAQGFETIVVVDGTDQAIPDLGAATVVIKEQGGPGAARNAGARATDRPIVLFLGDDMVPAPDLVARHVDRHNASPDDTVAVLGRVNWHREVADNQIARWLDWSGTQFDYRRISGEDAGFGRFYSCNVSLKRHFFQSAGGFDESFPYYYEDLDCGYRLGQKGMRLFYEPAACTAHLHRYDWNGLERRFRGIAIGEHHMAALHPWFSPFFLTRVRTAVNGSPPSRIWPAVVDLIPDSLGAIRAAVERRADRSYYARLAAPFLAGWAGAADLAELQAYLADDFDLALLTGHEHQVDAERERTVDEETFYRTSRMYLYDLTAFAMTGTKAPYLADLLAEVRPGASLLDYGCGIGADGLRLAAAGYQVSYADFANPSTEYLRWRLARRGMNADVFDLDANDIPSGFNAAYSFDVIEHVEDPFAFLAELEQRADVVAINFLEEDPHDTGLHRPLPIPALLDHAEASGLLRYRKYHDRSHFVIYRSPRAARPTGWGQVGSRARSLAQRHLGARLRGRPGWHPVPAP